MHRRNKRPPCRKIVLKLPDLDHAKSSGTPHKGRIHLRRSVDPLFAFPLQSDGGPYILGNYVAKLESFGRIVSE